MRKVKFLLLAALTAMFVGCQSDEVLEQDSGNDRPTPTGDTRITIEGEGMKDVKTRSSDGRVDFTGGYATGAGLYNGTSTPTVAAYPNPGYEVNYFYGGPANEPQKYDYAQSSASSFEVKLDGQDHRFHCGFKEKKRNLTVNAGSGGSVSPSGTNSYQVENAINITATPNTGYRFSGWTVTEGDATIANSGSSSTTATLHSSNSTITAKFERNAAPINLTIREWGESSGNAGYTKIKFEVSSLVTVSLEVTYFVEYDTWRDDGTTDGAAISVTIGANEELEIDSYDDDGYGNGERKTSTLERFIIKANGSIIYDNTNFPVNGSIYNGYQINVTNING